MHTSSRLLAVALLALAACAAPAVAHAAGSPLKVAPIKAAFVAKEFSTHYTTVATEPGAKLTYRWTLALQLVDAKGAADPTQPGSFAAVDTGCKNGGVLAATTPGFVWRHGPTDRCDHAKMGPSGHEGLITLKVSDGSWTCTATYKGTNDGTGGAATCTKAAPAATTTCTGAQVKLLDTSNGGGVLNGAKPPGFSTGGKAYCLVSITTYHWNNGQGKAPGTLGLAGSSTVGPVKATGSAGQGGAPNVNWSVGFKTTKPVVINGSYTCTDSDPATWSQDQQSGGKGFCIVYAMSAVTKGGKAPATKPPGAKKPGAKKPAPKAPAKGGKGKLAIKATPDNGNPPLTVTFTLSSPKVVQWRIDFGDGQSRVAIGSPPGTLTHTYSRAGDYRPKLTVLASATATSASTATTSIAVGTSLLRFVATPASGSPPLKVTFALGTSVKNITTWAVDFGDGQRTGGGGTPPASVSHTYTRAGTFAASLAVKPGSYALVVAFAQVTVGGGTPPALSLTATPTSGGHPLAVTFSLGTNIPGQVTSWQLQFGDGQRAGGSGRPPAQVSHAFARAGTYLAFLVVAQQQQYGGVQLIVPRNGLAITVR